MVVNGTEKETKEEGHGTFSMIPGMELII